jgi:hypothetical protein
LGSALSGSQPKAKRVALSHGLLEVLKKDEENNFHNVVTGYEYWLYLEYPHESA